MRLAQLFDVHEDHLLVRLLHTKMWGHTWLLDFNVGGFCHSAISNYFFFFFAPEAFNGGPVSSLLGFCIIYSYSIHVQLLNAYQSKC